MSIRVAVEPDLSPVKDFLKGKGYQVESINFNEQSSNNTNKFDVFVVTGLNTNFMGMNDTNTKAVVIQAAGMTPEQVYHELQSKFRQ